MMLKLMKLISAAMCCCAFPAVALANLPQAGDVAFGLSTSDPTTTLELLSGTGNPTMNGGTKLTSPWQTTPFIEVVKFDNSGGILHNAQGNVLGVDFGSALGGGQIYNLATTGVDPAPAGQLIVDTGTTNSTGAQIGGTVTQTRLGEIAVSPNNDKIVATGYDSGAVLVYDYTAGNTMGGGAAAANGRESTIGTLDAGHTQGVAWKDESTALVFGASGTLYTVSTGATVTVTPAKVVDTLADGNFTSLAYRPDISPYVYALYGGFDSVAGMTNNKLYVLDPANGYNVVKKVDLSTSLQTGRDIALDKNGNLFMSQFGGSASAPLGAAIDYLPAANVLNPATLTDNSSIDWYKSTTSTAFSGLDIGFGPAGVAGDYNNDGTVDAADYTVWRDHLGQTFTLPNRNPALNGPIGQDDYTYWKTKFGTGGPGAGSLGSGAVPEPSSFALLVIGTAAAGFVARRRG
jgi:hypothetical protein